MALTASTSGKLAQKPLNEDIAAITSQPVLLNECVSRIFQCGRSNFQSLGRTFFEIISRWLSDFPVEDVEVQKMLRR